MSEKKVWLITGAGRGLGVDIAKAALTAGHAVVATGRDATKVTAAVGDHDNLLAIKLDVTRPQDAQAAGDPAKLAQALVTLVGLKEPPARFAAGADAVQTFEAKANTLLAQAQAHRELSASLALDDR